MLEEFKWILIYFLLWWKGWGGVALVHVYVWEHIVTLNYSITWWIFTKLCRDKVLKTPLNLYWISLFGQICQGADPEQGHNTSMRGPFSKELLLQSGMLQQQTECIAIIYKHLGVLMTPAHLYWLLGQIRTVVDPGQGHNRSMRALLQRTTSSELEGHSNKPNVPYSSDLTAFGKKCCYFFFPFWCLVFDMFWCCTVLDLVISTYFNHVNGAECLIHINLCTESDLFPFLFGFAP